MMDDLLVYSVEQVAFEGDKGCTLSRLWEILNDFYTIYFNSSVYCIDDDFKSYFWNFFIFLSEIILNEVDERSTSLNLILKPIKTKVDLKLLKELYNDRIRITVIPEKQFLLLTGKELDEENKHVMRYFDLLSIIFKHKEKGINQVDLAKQLNIDPRSLPSRINPLIEKGLIIKSPIIISKTQTFLLTHSRYVIHSSQRYHNNFQNLQDTDNIMNINHLRVCITDILSKAENNVMRFVDLKRLCKINTKLFRRGFSRQIRSMEQLGFLERCRVLNNKGYSKCVKLVKPYNIGFLKQDEINILNDQDDENSSLEKDDSYDIKEEEPFSELIKSSSIKITRDLTIEFLLFQEIENSGKDGIPGPDLKKKVIGDQWSRPLQLILDKLSVIPEKSLNSDNIQPDYLSYFTIYKEQEFVGRINQYRYLSSSSYQIFCLENKIVNTIKFSGSNVVFPTYDKSKFYLYDENPNIPEKNTKIKSLKLGRPKKHHNDMIKDSEEKNQLLKNSFAKNKLSQNSDEFDYINNETDQALCSGSMRHNLNSKRMNSQEKSEEIFPRKKLKKVHITPPTKTVITRSCSNLSTTDTLNNSEIRDFASKLDNQASKASVLKISDEVSIENFEKSTLQNHMDKNDCEKLLDSEIYKESPTSKKKDSDLSSDFPDKLDFEKNFNIDNKNAQVSSLKHEPRISLAYVRRQNLILEILDKNNGILQGGKYLNEQYNIASKNKTYLPSEHEIDRKTMEKTLESLKRIGKIHHICVAHTNAKGVKNVFWIVADTKYDIDGLEISNFKNKILEERSMKIQTYKPLPLKIENLRINYPIKSKRRQSSLPDNEFSKHIQLNHIQYKHISEDSTLKGQELIPENTLINDHTFSSTPKKEISFVHTFVNNNEMTQKKVQVIESKSKLKFNGKSLFFHRKFLNQSTKDVFSSIEKQNLLDKNSSPDKTGEINDHEKVYKSVSIRRKNNFTSNDDDILIRAVFLSRWAYSGNTGFIDWELIKKILPHHSETAIKSRFSTLRSKNYIKEIGKFFTTSWLSYYQNAIENKILEPISPIPNDTDIITLVEYSKTLNILEDYDDIDLPDTIEEISANYIVENINKRADIRNDFFDISLSLNARELILYGTVFSYSNIDQNFQDENEIKSIIKSILITPEENYDPEIAKKLLEPYQEDHIESALQELIQDKIIVRSKSELNRILPGRNYRFSDKFLFAFKTCFPDFLFSQAAEFYTQITEEFQKNNVFTLSEFINSGSMACILDLVVHQYVQLSIENVMNVFCDHICQYDTQNWEDYTINFPVIAKPKNISYTLLDKSIKYENSLKRYIWIDISGNILKNVYNQYLQTILSFIIQRPGINLIELISILYPFISLQEIKAIISSLIPFIITDHHGTFYTKELYYNSIV